MSPRESGKFKNKPIVCALFTHYIFSFSVGLGHVRVNEREEHYFRRRVVPAEGSESRIEIQKNVSLNKTTYLL